jgi:heat shock protein HslJ
MITHKTGFAMAALLFLLLAACSQPGGDAEEGPDLEDPIWVMMQLNGKPPIAEALVTAKFAETSTREGIMSGSAGCNSYSGPFQVEFVLTSPGFEGDTKVKIGPLASTMMACSEPIMAQETEYLAALQAARLYIIKENSLTFKDAQGKVLVAFAAQEQALEGTAWEVISYNNGHGGVVSVLAGSRITANFGGGETGSLETRLAGNAGCNDYSAPYTTSAEEITIGPPEHTSKTCTEPQGVKTQERDYLAALQTAAVYRIEGNSLVLYNDEGATAVMMQRLP